VSRTDKKRIRKHPLERLVYLVKRRPQYEIGDANPSRNDYDIVQRKVPPIVEPVSQTKWFEGRYRDMRHVPFTDPFYYEDVSPKYPGDRGREIFPRTKNWIDLLGGKTVKENIKRIARLLREAAKELENETYKRRTIPSRKIGEFKSDSDNLEIQNEKTEAFLEEFEKIYYDSFEKILDYYDEYGYNFKYDRQWGQFLILVPIDYKELYMAVEEEVWTESEEPKLEEVDKRFNYIYSNILKLIDKLLDNIEQVVGPKSVSVRHETDDGIVIAINYPVLADIEDAIEEMRNLEADGELTAMNIIELLWTAAEFTVGLEENWYKDLIGDLKSFCRGMEEDLKKVLDLIRDFEDSLEEYEKLE